MISSNLYLAERVGYLLGVEWDRHRSSIGVVVVLSKEDSWCEKVIDLMNKLFTLTDKPAVLKYISLSLTDMEGTRMRRYGSCFKDYNVSALRYLASKSNEIKIRGK